jgi:hypothetical protein
MWLEEVFDLFHSESSADRPLARIAGIFAEVIEI